jgi:serine/threonine protein kinase
MTEISGYVFEPLWEDGEFVLSRGVRDGERALLLVLTPLAEQPSPSSIQRLEHSYALRDELDPAWAVQPLELVRNQGRPTLLLENPGGDLLARLVGHPWEVPQFLRVALGLAGALGQLHTRGLVHKDIKPAHILVNTASGAVWLTGFGIASRLPREHPVPEPPEVIAGTLAYMAPEQTGRMNRSIDARSDLYAYGVTLYELLTGTLPFTATDPLEWIHCHIVSRRRSWCVACLQRRKAIPFWWKSSIAIWLRRGRGLTRWVHCAPMSPSPNSACRTLCGWCWSAASNG